MMRKLLFLVVFLFSSGNCLVALNGVEYQSFTGVLSLAATVSVEPYQNGTTGNRFASGLVNVSQANSTGNGLKRVTGLDYYLSLPGVPERRIWLDNSQNTTAIANGSIPIGTVLTVFGRMERCSQKNYGNASFVVRNMTFVLPPGSNLNRSDSPASVLRKRQVLSTNINILFVRVTMRAEVSSIYNNDPVEPCISENDIRTHIWDKSLSVDRLLSYTSHGNTRISKFGQGSAITAVTISAAAKSNAPPFRKYPDSDHNFLFLYRPDEWQSKAQAQIGSISSYTTVVYIFPESSYFLQENPDVIKSGLGGTANIGYVDENSAVKYGKWIRIYKNFVSVLGHEFGHTFGMGHASLPGIEYADASCVMSDIYEPEFRRSFNIAHRLQSFQFVQYYSQIIASRDRAAGQELYLRDWVKDYGTPSTSNYYDAVKAVVGDEKTAVFSYFTNYAAGSNQFETEASGSGSVSVHTFDFDVEATPYGANIIRAAYLVPGQVYVWTAKTSDKSGFAIAGPAPFVITLFYDNGNYGYALNNFQKSSDRSLSSAQKLAGLPDIVGLSPQMCSAACMKWSNNYSPVCRGFDYIVASKTCKFKSSVTAPSSSAGTDSYTM